MELFFIVGFVLGTLIGYALSNMVMDYVMDREEVKFREEIEDYLQRTMTVEEEE